MILSFRAKGSGLALGCGMDHRIETGGAFTANVSCEDDVARVVLKVTAKAGDPVCFAKYLSYHYSASAQPSEIRARTAWTLDRALEDGFAGMHERQKSHVQAFDLDTLHVVLGQFVEGSGLHPEIMLAHASLQMG